MKQVVCLMSLMLIMTCLHAAAPATRDNDGAESNPPTEGAGDQPNLQGRRWTHAYNSKSREEFGKLLEERRLAKLAEKEARNQRSAPVEEA